MYESWYAYLTSEDGVRHLGYAKDALIFLCGGTALACLNRVRALLPGPKPEVVRVLDAIKESVPDTLELGAARLKCMKFRGSDLCVVDGSSDRSTDGVIYNGTDDQSDLFEPHELRRFLREARRRRKDLLTIDRAEGRKLVAGSVPPRKV